MNWRDLFYFSKGERRALVLLLCLITAGWTVLMLTEPPMAEPEQALETAHTPAVSDSLVGTPSPAPRQPAKKRSIPGRNSFAARRPYSGTYYPRSQKLPAGSTVELNAADTTLLQKVPGIGSTFARRITRYRALLGGFYSVSQLTEVYGIDEDRYRALKGWFTVDTSLLVRQSINALLPRDLYRHPYLNATQAKSILQLRRQKGMLHGWEDLLLLEEFTAEDIQRLLPYLSFQ